MAKVSKVKEEQTEAKKQAYELAIDKLNKLYGVGTVIYGDQKSLAVEGISTGSLGLDIAIGVNVMGAPRGRIVEVVAPESAGKTTLCLHIVANAQKQGIKCAYIDMEHHLSGSYATMIGVNLKDLILSQPSTGESAMEVARQLIESGQIGVVIIDSVAALVPLVETQKEIGSGAKMAGIGRLMSEGLRVLNPIVEVNNCVLMFTNQIRMDPGGMVAEQPAGGRALRFYAGLRLDMRRVKNDKDEELSRTKIKVLKNKVGTAFKEIEVDLIWGEGFGRHGEIVDMATELGIIVLAGSWYKWPGKNGASIAQGRNAMIELLKDNPEMKEEWESKIISMLKGEEVTEQGTPEPQEVIEEVKEQ